MKLNVAISMRATHIPESTEERDVLSQDWYPFLTDCGIRPLLVPNIGEDVKEYLTAFDLHGIILTGGNNVSPAFCGQAPREDIGDTSRVRDETEKEMITLALEECLPLLGVCRGIQMINAYFGGRIIFNFTKKSGGSVAHVDSTHEISIEDSRLKESAGGGSILVNSYHNNAFTGNDIGKGLLPAAYAADGSVEALVHEELPIVGIMWHPERENPFPKFNLYLVTKLFSKNHGGFGKTV